VIPLRPRHQFIGRDLPLVSPEQRLRLQDGETVELLDAMSTEGRDPHCSFALRFLGDGEAPHVWRCRTSRIALTVLEEVRQAKEAGESIGLLVLAPRTCRVGHEQPAFRN